MAAGSRRALAALVFVAALAGFFCYHGFSNDHFDRLARARQIAVYGDVPFRDFFDPGYFLTLYTSALLQRLFGDNLLGETLLNIGCMAAGAMLVFLLASRVSRSVVWGLVAAGLVVFAEPRPYDYDKVLFYPLGLYVCWRYIDRPSLTSLAAMAATATIAGLFRYDSGIYLGAAALVSVAARHWGEWRIAIRRVALLAALALLVASPSLIFIQSTAGLDDAYRQVTTYARREGARTSLFRMSRFDVGSSTASSDAKASDGESGLWNEGSGSGFQRINGEANAAAWLHWIAVALPPFAAMLLPLSARNRERATLARLLCYSALAEFAALFILRDPVIARIGAVVPLIVIGLGILIGECHRWLHPEPGTTAPSALRANTALIGTAIPCILTIVSLWALLWYPPKSNIRFVRRFWELSQVPPSLRLMPKPDSDAPLVEYIRACTKPSDAFFEPWFGAELYFFSGRAFAAGLPVVFGDHWSEEQNQQRSIRRLETQMVPLIVTKSDDLARSHDLLWAFIVSHYDQSRSVKLGTDTPEVTIWTRRGFVPPRVWGPFSLPCFAEGA